MQQLPRDVINIIMKYVTDMQLFELTPTPGKYTGSITPLNFDLIFGATTLTDLLLANILEAVIDSNHTTDLTALFVYSQLAEVIDFPLDIINKFERAHELWVSRCKLYGLPESLPPSWSSSLPFMVCEFLHFYDVDLLCKRLHKWLGSYDITVRATNPLVLLHTLP